MKKIILSGFAILIVFLILAPILFSIIINSTFATHKIIALCQKHIPELSYSKLEGKLLGHLEIENLHVKTAAFTLNINKLILDTQLKHFQIIVDKALADGVDIKFNYHLFARNKTAAKKMTIPPLVFKDMTLQHIKITLPQLKTIAIQSLHANAKLLKNHYQLLIKNNQNDQNNVFEYAQNSTINHLKINLPVNHSLLKITGYSNQKNGFLLGSLTDAHEGNLNFQVNVTFTPKPQWQISALAKEIHMEDLWSDYWPGYVSFNFKANHHHDVTRVHIDQLSGVIKQQALTGYTAIILDKQNVSHINCQLQTPEATLGIVGHINPDYALDWTLHISDLNKLLPHTRGSINSQGEIRGDLLSPNFKGLLQIEHLDSRNYQIKHLNGQFLISSIQQPQGNLHLSADQIQLKNLYFDQLKIDGDGTFKNHQVNAVLNSKQQHLTLAMTGQYLAKTWRANLNQLNIHANNQVYQLKNTGLIEIAPENLRLQKICLASQASELCIDAGKKANDIFADISAKHFDLSLFNPFLPKNYSLAGKINLNASATTTSSHSFTRKMIAELSRGAFTYSLHDSPTKISYEAGKVKLLWDEKALNTSLEMHLSSQAQLLGQILLPQFNLKQDLSNQSISGKLNWQTSNLNFLEFFIPYAKNVHGKLNTKVALSGNLIHPAWSMDTKLENASFMIPALEIKPQQIMLAANGDQREINYSGSLNTGTGKLLIQGRTSLIPQKSQTNLSLSGKDLLIFNTKGIKITTNPQINLKIADKQIYLNGSLFVPSASLQPYDFSNSQTLSDDVVFVKEKGEMTQNNNIKVHSNIKLTLGDKIYLNYRGIKGQIVGALNIQDNPSSTTTASGQLSIQNGSYTIRGKTLEIDYGKLNFIGGPISNPVLDIRASRGVQNTNNLLQVDQLRVGLSVLGTLKQPKIELFSEPPGKSQADILSYLLLGMPTSEASGANTQLLIEATDALNLGGTNKLLNLKNQLQKNLGLSEMDIGTNSEVDPKTQKTTTRTSVVLGKYFSPKFYVNYSFDIFNYTNTLKVRYLLNKYWILQSVTNTNGSGIDVLYSQEK